MSVSTEATVRAAIVGAIRDIGATGLGFDDPLSSGVKDYLIDYEDSTRWGAYLSALVGGKKTTRAWGVHVDASETLRVANGLQGEPVIDREYQARVVGYYRVGVGGAGVNLLIDHARLVRRAVYGLGSRLGGLVDIFLGVEDLSLQVREVIDNDGGAILSGEMIFRYSKSGASF